MRRESGPPGDQRQRRVVSLRWRAVLARAGGHGVSWAGAGSLPWRVRAPGAPLARCSPPTPESTTLMDREQFKLQLEIKKLTESIDRVRLDVSELKSGLRALREEFDDMKQEREEWREAHP
jgi:hypothetical protein